MFGMDNLGRYMDAKHKERKRRKVSRAEFVRLMVKGGVTKDQAEMQAKICAIFGSEVLVGDEWLEIGKKPKGKKK